MSRHMFFLLALLPAVAMYALHFLLKSWINPRRSAWHLFAYILLHLLGVFMIVYVFGMIFPFWRL